MIGDPAPASAGDAGRVFQRDEHAERHLDVAEIDAARRPVKIRAAGLEQPELRGQRVIVPDGARPVLRMPHFDAAQPRCRQALDRP